MPFWLIPLNVFTGRCNCNFNLSSGKTTFSLRTKISCHTEPNFSGIENILSPSESLGMTWYLDSWFLPIRGQPYIWLLLQSMCLNWILLSTFKRSFQSFIRSLASGWYGFGHVHMVTPLLQSKSHGFNQCHVGTHNNKHSKCLNPQTVVPVKPLKARKENSYPECMSITKWPALPPLR